MWCDSNRAFFLLLKYTCSWFSLMPLCPIQECASVRCVGAGSNVRNRGRIQQMNSQKITSCSIPRTWSAFPFDRQHFPFHIQFYDCSIFFHSWLEFTRSRMPLSFFCLLFNETCISNGQLKNIQWNAKKWDNSSPS